MHPPLNRPARPLPLRDGVGPSEIQLPAARWDRALDFLQAHFPAIGAELWRGRMERGLVVDAAGERIDADSPYVPGARLYYYRELAPEPPIPFEATVLHRDEHLLVADKPHFLPVVPAGRFLQQSLLVRLKKTLGLEELVPLHRIDRGTAGLVLFSTNAQTRGRYQRLFARREVGKHYEALAPGLPGLQLPLTRCSRIVEGEPFFRMREVDGAPNSQTLIESQEARGAASLYRLQPLSGRKHQLRVHLAALGAPILNDPLYPLLQPQAGDDYTRPLKLLARRLVFRDPLSGVEHCFESRLEL